MLAVCTDGGESSYKYKLSNEVDRGVKNIALFKFKQ